ncbi:MAG: DUF6427 family protein, partial [Bacteroidota bacterium]
NVFDILGVVGKLLLIILSVFVLDFIISKNDLTQRNSYAILSLALLMALFPAGLISLDIIIANLFVLFAMRRLITLHSNLNIKKKLFDAAFWISLATLFYFWAILFLIIVFIAVLYYAQNDVKNVLIPFAAVLSLLIILVAYYIITYDEYFIAEHFDIKMSTDFSIYNSLDRIIAFTIFFTISVWTFFYYLRLLGERAKKLKPAYIFIIWWYSIAFVIALIAPTKDQSEFIFLFAPLSIIMANYLEVITERWFKDGIVYLLVITPIALLLL